MLDIHARLSTGLFEAKRKANCSEFLINPAALSEAVRILRVAGQNLCISMLIMGKLVLRQLALATTVFALAAMAQISEAPAQGPIRIISPTPGEVVHQSFITVRYQLVEQAESASSPSFQVQLDASDPVLTNEQQQGFRGLQPGKHTVQVQAVDANGTPVRGTRAEVEFTVVLPHSSLVVPEAYGAEMGASQPNNGAGAASDPTQLPGGSSALPILSAVGLGALVGGIFAVLRTRN